MSWSLTNPPGLVLQFKDAGQFIDVGGTTPCTDGLSIIVWADQKNANNGVLVGGAYNPPIYHTGLLNGLPGGTFDGVGNALKCPNLLTGTKSHHVFIVLKQGGLLNTYSSVFGYGAVTALTAGALFVKSNGKTAWFIPNVIATPTHYSYDGTGVATYVSGTAYILEARCDQVGGTGTTYQNGILDNTLTIGGSIDAANALDGHMLGNYTGAGSGWPGSILEVLVYQGVLSTPNRNLAGSYLATKWGITTSYTAGPSNTGIARSFPRGVCRGLHRGVI